MKVIISIVSLLSFIIYCFLIQPLLDTNTEHLSEITTIISSIIGATGSIVGGIIGGVITGYVAFKVARFELDKDSEQNELEKKLKQKKYRKLIIKEIETNNLALRKLDEASNTEEIETTLKYSLSDSIFYSIKTELEVDEFFMSTVKYYRILNRLITDVTIHNEDEFELIDNEIRALMRIEDDLRRIIVSPTSK